MAQMGSDIASIYGQGRLMIITYFYNDMKSGVLYGFIFLHGDSIPIPSPNPSPRTPNQQEIVAYKK